MNFNPYLPYAFALFLAIPFLVLMREFISKYVSLKNMELQFLQKSTNYTQKLQAYERMTLFLERLKPANLVANFSEDLAPKEFIFLSEKSINEEYNFNTSQQIYFSVDTWRDILNAKNEVIQLLRKTYEEVHSSDLTGFKTVFLMKYVEETDFISDIINNMRREIAH